jgi:RNA polymerase sigma-70 factor (ECF subfamily)
MMRTCISAVRDSNDSNDSFPKHPHFETESSECAAPDSNDNGAAEETITRLLTRLNAGDRAAFDLLIPLVYEELHRIAAAYMKRQPQNHTLQPTALINEAYLKLVEYGDTDYQNRKHFYAVAAKVMRRLLVDHARASSSAKRGAGAIVALDQDSGVNSEPDRIVMALDDALRTLAAEDGEKARLVEMRFFGGMTAEEIAESVSTPVHIVRRELRMAQIRLQQEIRV